ncbi:MULTISPECIES: RNA-binding protein [unclassified Bradyrhizobium]|uniref:RNA-binding protein n=1 Tax=unclassified Bradyrhizobium TaxID=2631580 RepID=UPI001FF6433A|nr:MULTISPECIES: RNA-binding protein [unclassified Bradyrhizobium]MCJ9703874.1 RNA-binding protein [Bradyrhizobium sp. SHOUNA76]MCJ9734116.1 RNA-binding protein [Bradyrhizobium sp. PRIMUS42]
MLTDTDPELDHGPRTERSATMRMCAVSRQVRPIDELIRFVISPQGDVVPDLKRKLPGRGMWLTASRGVVAEAVRRHHFGKAFKRELRIPQTFPADIEALLVRSVTEVLGIAAKAGQIVAGFGKVESALREGTVEVLIHASDGAADGIRKLDTLARQNDGNRGAKPQIPVVTVLKSVELDLALTRSNVIHAALLAGPASKSFLSRSQMLVRYRMADADKTAEKPGQDF